MWGPKLTLEQIRKLNDQSRKRSLKIRKAKTQPYVVREGKGGVYTIKVIYPDDERGDK